MDMVTGFLGQKTGLRGWGLPVTLFFSLFLVGGAEAVVEEGGQEEDLAGAAAAAGSEEDSQEVAGTAGSGAQGVEALARQVAGGVQQFYERTEDLVAQFDQEYVFSATGARRRSSGRVFFKKPGMMRWDYLHPEVRYFITDGQELLVYEPEARQAFRRSLTESGLTESVAFLFGQGDIQGTFQVSLEENPPEGRQRLSMVPVQDEGHYRKVTLEVDKETYQVLVSEVEDPTGNINRITFKDVKINVGLPASGFQSPIPKGVKIIEAGAGL